MQVYFLFLPLMILGDDHRLAFNRGGGGESFFVVVVTASFRGYQKAKLTKGFYPLVSRLLKKKFNYETTIYSEFWSRPFLRWLCKNHEEGKMNTTNTFKGQ